MGGQVPSSGAEDLVEWEELLLASKTGLLSALLRMRFGLGDTSEPLRPAA